MVTTHAVIMAGGSGTRFWPASRRHHPKQLLPLTGRDSMLAETLRRLEGLCRAEHVAIATGAHLVEATLSALPSFPREQLLVEPVAKNTAPCLAWAAATVARSNPEAVVVALPADQHIEDEKAFSEVMKRAIASAASGTITTIGIEPTHPETGYGYIEAAEAGGSEARAVRRFVEKPDATRAKTFLEAGNFYWNAGMFFFRACDMLAAVERHMPQAWDLLAQLDAAAAEGKEDDVIEDVFRQMPSISIDHGIMEHLEKLAVVPGRFGWSDVGSWLSASELSVRDNAGNSAPEHAVLIDAKDNHVVDLRSDEKKRTIAIVGCEQLVVVQTDDALLVVPRDRAQEVRDVVAALKERGDSELV